MFFGLNMESAWRGCVSVWKSASCAGDQVRGTALGQTAMVVMMSMMETMRMVMIVMLVMMIELYQGGLLASDG